MLIGNHSVFLKSPGRWLAGNSTAGNAHPKAPSNFNRPAEYRSGTLRDGSGDAAPQAAQQLIAIPAGYSTAGWRIAGIAGDLTSGGDAVITLTATGSLVMGLAATGEASIALTASGSVQAVAPVAGTATLTLGAEGLVQAVAEVAGTAPITLTASGTIGATAALSGAALISLTASANLFATATVGGTAYFSAAAEGTQLTPASIATAVWGPAAVSYNEPGTMGAKLNAAGSGGVDLAALAAAVWAHTVRGLTQPTEANVKYVNNVPIKGTGVAGDTWGPVP